MSDRPIDILTLLDRSRNGELSPEEVAYLEQQLKENDALNEELVFMESLQSGVRKDTEKACDAVHFPNFAASVMQQIETDTQPKPSVWNLIKQRYNLALGLAGLAVVVLGLQFYPGGIDRDESISLLGSDCVVERLENTNSTAIVFEAEPKQEKEEPVTVIWVFEEENQERSVN